MNRKKRAIVILSTTILATIGINIQNPIVSWASSTKAVSIDKWKAERSAVSVFSEDLDTRLVTGNNSNTSDNIKNKKLNLAEIGKNYTINNIAPLGDKDFSLAGYTLGEIATLHQEPYKYDDSISLELDPTKNEKIPHISSGLKDNKISTSPEGDTTPKVEDKKTSTQKSQKVYSSSEKGVMLTQEQPSTKGYFTTYTGNDGYYTIYTGPLVTSGSLRQQGLRYHYSAQVVTDIHIASGEYSTSRDISIGSSRGEVLFSYGVPNMLWRNPKTNALIMLYEGKVGNQVYYQSFTIEDNKVSHIDYFDKQVMPHFAFPNTPALYLKAGNLVPEDFSMMGYTINKPFIEASDDAWQAKGTLYDDDFSSYDGFLVSYDSHHLVSRVLLNKRSGITRRGVSIGDTKYLMLFLYGQPTFIEDGINKGTVKSKVYGYKNPDNKSYLLFTVEDGQDFISSVMLSDRTFNELEHINIKEQEEKRHD